MTCEEAFNQHWGDGEAFRHLAFPQWTLEQVRDANFALWQKAWDAALRSKEGEL